MTIPTPTSEGLAGLAGAVPAGLPDEVTLARLAGEFFAALPTGFGGASALSLPNAPRAPAQGGHHPGGLPHLEQTIRHAGHRVVEHLKTLGDGGAGGHAGHQGMRAAADTR